MIRSLLHGFPVHNVRVVAVAGAILALSAAIAGFVPARRAASTHPYQELRAE